MSDDGDTDTDIDGGEAATERGSAAAATVGIDAPLAVKARAFAPTLRVPVHGPGEAETVAAAPVGVRTAVRGQHNWVPIGPRNVGGRVRAIAVEPGDPRNMYAAPASGGVFKSTDGGDSWFPLWHDEPSLSMAALDICRANQAVVWAATGETSAGGAEVIPAAGVWRSPDRGETWQPPNPGQGILGARIHGVAAHPGNDQICWAAAAQRPANRGGPDGTEGLYRTTDGGQTWIQFAAGRGFTDVKMVILPTGPAVFAVPQGVVQTAGPPVSPRALLVRIPERFAGGAPLNPDEPDPAPGLAAALPAFAGPFAPDADPLQVLVGSELPAQLAGTIDPDRAKLAIYPGGAPGFADPVVYVVLVHEEVDAAAEVDRGFTAMFRCRNAHNALATAMTFTRIPPAPTFRTEGQGEYNLAFAVSPLNPNHLAFGMVELYLHRRANATPAPAAGDWLRAQQGDLYHIERGHHLDHHDVVFAPAPAAPFNNGVAGGALVLWDANDGGVSWCPDWLTADGYALGAGPEVADAVFPPPADALAWRKRSHGISATQMYDLTQHPRLPSVIGCGFQDNGVYLGLAGPSWQLVLTADGGYVAFDPDDPYRMIVTFQNGLSEARFPGRLRDSLPLPRDRVQMALWPRDLEDGFHGCDGALFSAETAFHPTVPGRVLTARRHRLYATRRTTGDRWIAEPLGTTFEIFHRPGVRAATSSTIEVLDTAGGRAIGLVPQRTVTRRGNDGATGEDGDAESRVRAVKPEPYTIAALMDVRLRFEHDVAGAVPIPITVPLTIGADLPAVASAAQVATYLTNRLRAALAALAAPPAAERPVVEVLTAVLPAPRELLIASTDAGRARQVVLDGSAQARLGYVARAYHGADAGAGPGAAAPALPAIAPLAVSHRAGGMDLAGRNLRVTRQGGANAVDIVFDTEFPPPASSHVTIGQLAAVLRRRLPPAQYEVWTSSAFRGLRLTSTAATDITVTGNLTVVQAGATDTDVALEPADPARTRRLTARDRPTTWLDTIDLSAIPPPVVPATDRTLRLAEGGRQTALRPLDLAFLRVTDLTRVTMVELCDAVREMLRTALTVRIRCDLELSVARDPDEVVAMGELTELAFGPPGSRVAYAGDVAGRVYRSSDDGETWVHRPSVLDERAGECDAIAVQPDQPDTVLVGLYEEGLLDPAAVMLFRSTDGGTTFAAAPAQIDNGLPVADPNRRVVGVRALVFDPGAPGHVYAATDLGVHHSPDAGRSWVPFNEGLPNVRVTDLALATQTRMLRAGAWGRGVHERCLGGRDVHDVRLHVRTTAIDDGTAQPAPGPDLLAALPESFRFDTSPDVKVLRRDPRIGVLLDGAEFDDEVRGGDVRAGSAFVGVQVHNRGAFTTTRARVVALWAPADIGPPPLPPELWPALAAPVAAGTAFGLWKVIGDEAVSGPAGTGHDAVAPGYPRVHVFGAAPALFSWPATVEDHRRIGIVAIAHAPEDPLPAPRAAPVEVLDLVRTEAKAAYRECNVLRAAEDDQVLLRTTDGSRLAVQAVAGAQNGANGAAPFGLTAVALPGVTDVRFATPGPYVIPAPRRRFNVQAQVAATAAFAADDPSIPNLARVVASQAVDVLNRTFLSAGLPVRAIAMEFGAGNDNAIRLNTINTARFTASGTAAATFGVTAAAPVAQRTTPGTPVNTARRSWNLTAGAPQTLTVTVTTTVEIRLDADVAAPAADVRAAINRQLGQGGIANVVAEPLLRRLSVSRSATEAAGVRHGIASSALADLVVSSGAVAAVAAQLALFDVVGTHALDTVAPGANHFYLRSANTGNVSEGAVRHRLFMLDVTASPVTTAQLGAAAGVVRPLPAGSAVIAEFAAVDVAGVAAGEHRYVLAIADVNQPGLTLDPAAADLTTLEAVLTFCVRHPNAAVREFVVA